MGDIGSLVVNDTVVLSIQVHRLGIVMSSYSSDLLCSSLSSDRAAETSLGCDPFVTMSPRLSHRPDDCVSHGMSCMEKVVEFDIGA